MKSVKTLYAVVDTGRKGERLLGVYTNLGHALNRQEHMRENTGVTPEIRVMEWTGEVETAEGSRRKVSDMLPDPITTRAVNVIYPEFTERGHLPFVESVCGTQLDKRW